MRDQGSQEQALLLHVGGARRSGSVCVCDFDTLCAGRPLCADNAKTAMTGYWCAACCASKATASHAIVKMPLHAVIQHRQRVYEERPILRTGSTWKICWRSLCEICDWLFELCGSLLQHNQALHVGAVCWQAFCDVLEQDSAEHAQGCVWGTGCVSWSIPLVQAQDCLRSGLGHQGFSKRRLAELRHFRL